MSDIIRVVIIDDHPVVRAGIRAVLEKATAVLVVAEGENGADALRLVFEYRPDVLVLDVNLPDITGLEVTKRLKSSDSKTAILILTLHDDTQTVFDLLEAGALGYVLKDEALESLAKAIQATAAGETWLSPAIARKVVKRAVGGEKEADPLPDLPEHLTRRELEVLCLLAQGLDNAAIAEQLVLTKRTVQNHISNIYSKLALNSRTEAMLFAIQRGLVDIPPLKE